MSHRSRGRTRKQYSAARRAPCAFGRLAGSDVNSNDPGRTRTCNTRLRWPMPYPLGHGARQRHNDPCVEVLAVRVAWRDTLGQDRIGHWTTGAGKRVAPICCIGAPLHSMNAHSLRGSRWDAITQRCGRSARNACANELPVGFEPTTSRFLSGCSAY